MKNLAAEVAFHEQRAEERAARRAAKKEQTPLPSIALKKALDDQERWERWEKERDKVEERKIERAGRPRSVRIAAQKSSMIPADRRCPQCSKVKVALKLWATKSKGKWVPNPVCRSCHRKNTMRKKPQ